MGRSISVIQNNFTAGEISPRLIGRSDVRSYNNALRSLQNFTPFVHGGIQRRSGSRFIAEVENSNNFTRLYEFNFNNIQTYVLEFGNQRMRIYKSRGRVENPPGTPVTVNTPWTSSDLAELKFVQSADVLYVFHPDYLPRKITRTSDISWTLTDFVFRDGPYLPINITSTTVAASATTGTVTLTASAAVFTVSTDVNRLIRLRVAGTWGYARITAVSSTTTATALVLSTLGGTSATVDWRLGSWSGTTGWPECATFHEERLVIGATRTQPQTIWGSVVGDFENFQPSATSGTVADTDAFTYTISSDQVNNICWLVSGSRLSIGTTGGEFTAYGGTNSGFTPITPTNITIRPETTYGSAKNIRPRKIGNSVIYVTGSRRRIREMGYDFSSDSYQSGDLTLLAEHLTKVGISDIAYQKDVESSLWVVRDDGVLCSMTYDKQQQVSGWARHVIGGVWRNTSTNLDQNAVVESVAVIPSPSLDSDDVYIVVKRTINGATKRYVEYIETSYDAEIDQPYNAFYVDSGLTFSGSFNTALSRDANTGSATFSSGTGVFSVSDVGKKIKYMEDGIYGEATITSFSSSTTVIATINGDMTKLPNPFPANKWFLTTTSVSGLDHLALQTVSIYIDGSTHADKTVSSGGIVTLDKPGGVVHVGLKQTCKFQTLPIEITALGTIRGKKYKIAKVDIGLSNTMGFKYGQYDDGTLTQILNGPGQPMNAPPPLLNTLYRLNVGGDFIDEAGIVIKEDLPVPITILFIAADIFVHGD